MESYSSVILKFDIYGNQIEYAGGYPIASLDSKQESVPLNIKNDILKDLSNEIKPHLYQLETVMEGKINEKVNDNFKLIENKIKNELVSYFTITKSYVGFNKRRIVSVSEGKDNNDVVILKQVKNMLEDFKIKNSRSTRSIDIKDVDDTINKKLLDYVTKIELGEKIEKLSQVLIHDVISKVQLSLDREKQIYDKIEESKRLLVEKINKEVGPIKKKLNEKISEEEKDLEKSSIMESILK